MGDREGLKVCLSKAISAHWRGFVGAVLSYKEEVVKAMRLLVQEPRVVVLGQGVCFPCAVGLSESLECFPADRKIELPIMEDCQLGMCIGLSLQGFIPLAVYPRIDFLLLAMGQLCLHLDKFKAMSHGQWAPKVLIRTSIGSKYPLDAGPQHTGDYTEALCYLLPNTDVVKLELAEDIVPAYQKALASPRSAVLVELSGKR